MQRGITAITIVALSGQVVAADLNTNLVRNGNFESVDTNTSGPFTSVFILDWIDADADGDDTFAYPYSSQYSGANVPPDAGDYHYAGGFNTGSDDLAQPQLFQIVDLSTGEAAALIASGNAFYDLRAFFSSYRTQGESSTVTVLFQNSGGETLVQNSIGGSAFVSTLPINGNQVEWGEDRRGGVVPVGTVSIVVGIFANGSAGNHDGYVDNINFQVTNTRPPIPPSAFSIETPTNGSFVTELPSTIDWTDASAASSYDLIVTDRDGQTVLSQNVTASEFELTSGSIADGVYDVMVIANNQFGSTAAAESVNFGIITGDGVAFPGCNIADIAEPYGVLNFFDVSAFLAVFNSGCP